MSLERIHEEAFAVERVHFKKTKKRVNPRKVDPLWVMEGSLPVLVSAPRAVRTLQEGKVRASDEFTGAYTFLLSRETGCHAVAARKLYGGDPDGDASCPYKERLREIAVRHCVRLALDLRGAARAQPFDIAVGMIEARSSQQRALRRRLVEALKASGIEFVDTKSFPVPGSHTVLRFLTEELGIPALQLEINRRYRAPNRNGEDYDRMFQALAFSVGQITDWDPNAG